MLKRRRTCIVCRRRCRLWATLSARRFAAGELVETVRRYHGPPRPPREKWPERKLRRPAEWEELA